MWAVKAVQAFDSRKFRVHRELRSGRANMALEDSCTGLKATVFRRVLVLMLTIAFLCQGRIL